jgi:alginate O-acetyltransferase complex protein AlgJ
VAATEISDATLPRAVMFHDSFGESLQPFLSQHFSRIVYSSGPADWRRNCDPQLVERERPQLVIQEIAERLLAAPAALLKAAEGI